MFTFISSCFLLVCILQVSHSASPLYGDASVILYKDFFLKKQLNVFQGDQFLVDVSLRQSGLEEYLDISRINVTQRVKGVGLNRNVTFVLERIENDLFNVTSVSPVNQVGGKNQTVVSASVNTPYNYITRLVVRNSLNTTLSNRNILRIALNSYGIVTNSGISVMISPFP